MPSVLPRPRWALTPNGIDSARPGLRRATVSPLPDPASSFYSFPQRGRKSAPVKDIAWAIPFFVHRRSVLCCTFRRLRLAAYSARPLTGIPLCEARTFLPVQKARGGCLTGFPGTIINPKNVYWRMECLSNSLALPVLRLSKGSAWKGHLRPGASVIGFDRPSMNRDKRRYMSK